MSDRKLIIKLTKNQNKITMNNKNINNSMDIKKILVPLDGSAKSEKILPYAWLFSEWFSSELNLFHSLPPKHPLANLKNNYSFVPDNNNDRGLLLAGLYMKEVQEHLGKHNINSKWGIASGQIASMIVSRAVTSSIGLIAMIANPTNKIKRIFFPKSIDYLWKTTSCPILIVKNNSFNSNSTNSITPSEIITSKEIITNPVLSKLITSISLATNVPLLIFLDKEEIELGEEISELLDDYKIKYNILYSQKNITESIKKAGMNSPRAWIIINSKLRYGINRAINGSNADAIFRSTDNPIIIVPDKHIVNQRSNLVHKNTQNLEINN